MNLLINNGWFEIVEPKTEQKVFVNTNSGKCQWNPPEKYQRILDNQWWELYDFKTCHFYYYNVQTKETSWCKPNTTNLVSLVKLQVIKNQKNKIYVNKEIQTSLENLQEFDPTLVTECNENAISLNIDTSGVSTYQNSYVNHTGNENSYNVNENAKELSSTIPATRKFIPRTNPNITRHSQTLRLSQPAIELYENTEKLSLREQNIYLSSKSVDENENKDYNSLSSLPTVTSEKSFDSGNFPRNSVINAIDRATITSMEIWSRNLFNKSDSQLAGLLSWTAKTIPDSLLALTPKQYKKKVCENFKQIQMYMGDRELKNSKDMLAFTICQRGISSSFWANEIFMQLCKQVTYNPYSDRTFYGWELICICLKFFHPESVEMQTCFRSFLNQYACLDQKIDVENFKADDFQSKSIFCARSALKLLDMANKVNNLKNEDILEAKKTYGSLTMFFSSLEDVMKLQKKIFPERKLPWIQVSLSNEIFRCGGCTTQGIFRIPAEVIKIDALTQALERAFKPNCIQNMNNLPSPNGCDPLLNKILTDLNMEHDPLLLSSVLKNWFRHLQTPLIFFDSTDDPLNSIAKDYSKILRKINSLPQLNFMVLKHLIHFLQILSKPENLPFTNMPVENLVTLMAPTLFKSDIQLLQPAMQLLQSLIMNWDTSDIENIQ